MNLPDDTPPLAAYDRLVLRLLAEKVRTLLAPTAEGPPARNSQPLTAATED